jgi:hypothetical protein
MVNVQYEDIEGDLLLYEQGRVLRPVYKTPAWEIIMGVFEDYRDKARDELIALPPGDPYVVTAHAAASALDDVVAKAKQDFEAAVQAAAQPTQEVASYLLEMVEVNDVAASQLGHED